MIQMLTSVIGQRGVDAMAFLLAFALTALTDSIFRDKLPHDHGRAFAVNGELSKGKARGSGVRLILGRQRCARVLGTSLRLQHAPAQLQKVLRLAGIPCTENIEKENAQ